MLEAMNHDLSKQIRHSYLAAKAMQRAKHEEAMQQEATQTINRVKAREEEVKQNQRDASIARSSVADIDTESDFAVNEEEAKRGLEVLNQMNVDLENLIRHVYSNMKKDKETEA